VGVPPAGLTKEGRGSEVEIDFERNIRKGEKKKNPRSSTKTTEEGAGGRRDLGKRRVGRPSALILYEKKSSVKNEGIRI